MQKRVNVFREERVVLSKLKVLAAVLAVTLVAASPALAQETQDPETVTVTFRLSVDGQVPGWQHFGVDYPIGGDEVGDIPLCTTGTDSGMAAPPCRSGETYTASIEVPAGSPLAFDFVRNDTRTAPERFASEKMTLAEDTTVSAAYHFPGGTASAGTDSGADTGSRTAPLPSGSAEGQYAPASGDEGSTQRGYSGGSAATGGETGGGETGNGSTGAEASEGIVGGVLPDTGGATLLLAGAGALLTAAGLLAYRRAR